MNSPYSLNLINITFPRNFFSIAPRLTTHTHATHARFANHRHNRAPRCGDTGVLGGSGALQMLEGFEKRRGGRVVGLCRCWRGLKSGEEGG